MPEQPQYTGIVAKLTALQAKIARLTAARGLLMVLALASLFLLALTGLTVIAWLPATARIVIDILLFAGLIAAFYFWVARPFVNRLAFLEIARLLEGKYGKFQSRLIAALELHDLAKRNRENYSLELIDRTIEEAGGVIADIDTEAIIDYRPFNHWLGRFGVLLALIVAAFFINPSTSYNTWLLFLHPTANFEKPPEFSLSISPQSGEFYRNLDLLVKAAATGKTPRKVDIYYRFEDGAWASEPMAGPDSQAANTFAYTFKKIKRSIDLYARSSGVQSQRVHLDVVDPPRIMDLNLSFNYPDYSGLQDAQGNPNDGNAAALRGTRVHIEARANKPLSESYQLFSDSTKIPLKVDGENISGDFTIKDNGRYTLMLQDLSSHINPEPIWYDIQALEDYPPAITIRYPAADVDLNEQMTLPLDIAIVDDYGFGKLNLVYWVLSEGQQSQPSRESLKIPGGSLDQEVSYEWNMQSLNPLPGDIIYYYAEVSDNDIVSGPKWAKSRTFSARLPNLDEILADVQGSQDQQMETLEEALKSQKELQKQIEQISREMMKASEVDYQKQQEAKKALEKQQDLAKKLDDLAKEMDRNLSKLEDNKLIGEQIAEKMQELQQLMEEIAPPELKEAMKKLQEAIDKMDPEALKKALEQFQLTAEQLLENLDRALSLMQKLALEQKMDMLVQLAEKIVAQQQNINENAEAAMDSSALAAQSQSQQNNSDEFNTLKEQFGQMQQMNENLQMIPPEQNSNAEKQVNNPEIPPDFNDMKAGMCQGNSGACKNKGKKLHKELSDVAEALKGAQKAMQQQQKMEIARKMQKAAQDLLYLSDRQEDLLDSTKSNQNTGDGLRQMATGQMQIASASSRTADVISDLSKETIFVNNTLMRLLGMTLADMSDATTFLDKRSSMAAIQSEQSAMSNLNKTVYLLLQARDNTMSSGSGSGLQEMLKQMEQMSQMQGGINEQTMSLMPKPGAQMTIGQQQALQNLASQQEALRRQLDEMNDRFGKQGDMLGRLDQLGEEMKKVVEDLQKSRVNQETVKRQEGILSRMLDAQKSVNRRDFSKKRQSEQGTDMVRKSPTLPENFDGSNGELSEMIKKALEEQYPRQYEKLIRAYFKSMQNQNQGNDVENK